MLAFAPLSGVCALDYFVLRWQRLDDRALFQDHGGFPYAYWHGISSAAIAAVALGALTYFRF